MEAALAIRHQPATILGIEMYQEGVRMVEIEKQVTVTLTIPTAIEGRIKEVLDENGLSLTDAVNLYLYKIAECGRIPYERRTAKINLDNPNIIHAKKAPGGGLMVPSDWLDDDD